MAGFPRGLVYGYYGPRHEHELPGKHDLVHLGLHGSDATAIKMEMHAGMIGQQRHRHCRIHDVFRNHQSGQPQAERVVVRAVWGPKIRSGADSLLRPPFDS